MCSHHLLSAAAWLWAAPSPIENAQPSIQRTHLNNQFGEGISEDAMNKALVDFPKTQSHNIVGTEKVSKLPAVFERIRQVLRDSLYLQFWCNAKELRLDMHKNYFEVSTEYNA